MIKIGRRGSIDFHLTVGGAAGSRRPTRNTPINPIHLLVRMLDRAAFRAARSGDDWFGPSNLQVTSPSISATRRDNVVPARARARFNIRLNTLQTAETLGKWVRQRCDGVVAELGGGYALAVQAKANAFVTDAQPLVAVVAAAIEEETGVEPESYCRRDLGCPVHQGFLPGGGIRPAQPDNAPGRRAHHCCRSRNAHKDLPRYSGTIFRGLSIMNTLVAEARHSLAAAWLLARGDRTAYGLMNLSADGFWRLSWRSSRCCRFISTAPMSGRGSTLPAAARWRFHPRHAGNHSCAGNSVGYLADLDRGGGPAAGLGSAFRALYRGLQLVVGLCDRGDAAAPHAVRCRGDRGQHRGFSRARSDGGGAVDALDRGGDGPPGLRPRSGWASWLPKFC